MPHLFRLGQNAPRSSPEIKTRMMPFRTAGHPRGGRLTNVEKDWCSRSPFGVGGGVSHVHGSFRGLNHAVTPNVYDTGYHSNVCLRWESKSVQT